MTTGPGPSLARQAFREAAHFLSDTVARIGGGQWDAPGLGAWNVRELVGHAHRNLLAIERYAAQPAASPEVSSGAEYYRQALSSPDVHTRIAEGGPRAAEGLGDDPVQTVQAAAERVSALVESLSDDHPLQTQVGAMRLADYLPTRVLELTIHTLDIRRAVGLPETAPPPALRQTLYLIADMAAEKGVGAQLAMAATGRGPLPSEFSVVA